MDKFVELHTLKGETLTVNLSLVVFLFPNKKGTTLLFVDGLSQDVSETYEFLAVICGVFPVDDLKN